MDIWTLEYTLDFETYGTSAMWLEKPSAQDIMDVEFFCDYHLDEKTANLLANNCDGVIFNYKSIANQLDIEVYLTKQTVINNTKEG